MWNIQCIPCKVAGPHYYNDLFGRVYNIEIEKQVLEQFYPLYHWSREF